jgi:hypothetical protein
MCAPDLGLTSPHRTPAVKRGSHVRDLGGKPWQQPARPAGQGPAGRPGQRLHISAVTAKTHVSRLLTKLDAHDRAQLVMIAYETHLVTPG